MNPTKCTCGHTTNQHYHLWGMGICIDCPCQAFTSSGEDKTCIECSGKGEIILNQSHVGKPNKLVTCQRCNSTGVEPAAGDTEKDFGNPPVASESNQCVCGHDEADHKVMADRACWYEGVNGWGCGCPKFQPSHSEGDNPDSPSMPVDSIRKALKKSFTNLYVRQFTTDWQTQRLVRSTEIDVMDLAPLQALIKEAERNAVDAKLDKVIAIVEEDIEPYPHLPGTSEEVFIKRKHQRELRTKLAKQIHELKEETT